MMFFDGEIVGLAGRQGSADTVFRFVNRIRQKVDAQLLGNAEFGGKLDGLDAAALIKAIAVAVINQAQNMPRAFTINAPNQGFIGINSLLLDIDNRLKCHGEIKIQIRAVGAFPAINFAIIGGFYRHGDLSSSWICVLLCFLESL